MVYVDELIDWGWRLGHSCHMLPHPDHTDLALAELHEMAEKIGLKRAWFQNKRWPHYDLTGSKRRLALAAGAVSIKGTHYIRMSRDARQLK
jgi:hypothetical protein